MILASFPNDTLEEIPRSHYSLGITLTGNCHPELLYFEESTCY